MPANQHIAPSGFTIKVDGTVANLAEDLLEILVDTNLFMPAMAVITVKDALDQSSRSLKYADTDRPFKLGAELRIEASITLENPEVKATLFIGEIIALEPSLTQDSIPLFSVRAYDRAHRLTRGHKTRTYGDANPQSTSISEADIVKKIAGESGLSAQVDGALSSLRYSYVLQYNQTDWDFLWERARLYGFQVYVEDKKLNFQKADMGRGGRTTAEVTLKWGETLRSFTPRVTLMHQVSKATVTGWDPHKKQAIVEVNQSDTSKTIPEIGFGKKGSSSSKTAFGEAEAVVVSKPVLTINQAKLIAAAQFAAAESEFIQAEGVCDWGDPRLIAGRLVKIEGVGTRFSGTYYVTEARHTYTGHGGYEMTFKVSGRQPDTASALLHRGNSQSPALVNGVVTALVTDLNDPQRLGRVKVKYPWLPQLQGADLSSSWARLASPMAGKERGIFFTPEIDDEVLVAFEHGDMNYPYIVGTLWNNTDKPPAAVGGTILDDGNAKVDQRIIRSRSGHLIVLNDKQGEESILIRDKTGNNYIKIDSKTNNMEINVEGDLKITAKGKIDISSTKDMTFKSQAKGGIESMQDFSLKSSGGKIDVKATSGLSLDGTAKAELKGASVSLNGMADVKIVGTGMVSVTGALVKLN